MSDEVENNEELEDAVTEAVEDAVDGESNDDPDNWGKMRSLIDEVVKENLGSWSDELTKKLTPKTSPPSRTSQAKKPVTPKRKTTGLEAWFSKGLRDL